MTGGSALAKLETRKFALLFGALYFIQGIAEPTEGLIAQPVRSLLRTWGFDAAGIAKFIAVMAIPWYLKPLWGIVTDYIPIRGSRRKSWLMIWTFSWAIGLTWLWWFPPAEGQSQLLLMLLLIPTVGVCFVDVIVDALMVEEGQPRGITGTLQSVQWACLYGAAILTGWLGGYLSARGMQTTGFAICALAAGCSFLLAVFVVKEPPTPKPTEEDAEVAATLLLGILSPVKTAARTMWGAAKHPAVIGVGCFLFLIAFNPFGSSVRYVHMTDGLGLGEEDYGKMVSIQSVGAVAGAAAYGWICRRVPFKALIHLGIGAAVVSTLCWWGLTDARSALVIGVVYGFAMMIATLMQLDLAARYCPVAIAATVFALLMSLSNGSVSLSEIVGGTLYTDWIETLGRVPAFDRLVAVGAGFTCLCWALVPWLNRLEAANVAATEGADG